jgi:hypothetical protein
VYINKDSTFFAPKHRFFKSLKHESSPLSVPKKNISDCLGKQGITIGTPLDPLFTGWKLPLGVINFNIFRVYALGQSTPRLIGGFMLTIINFLFQNVDVVKKGGV